MQSNCVAPTEIDQKARTKQPGKDRNIPEATLQNAGTLANVKGFSKTPKYTV